MKKFLVLMGMPRCATSWLHSQVTAHAGVVEVPRKEIHYFVRQYGNLNRLSDANRLKALQTFATITKLGGKNFRQERGGRVDMGSLGAADDQEAIDLWKDGGVRRRRYQRLKQGLEWYLKYVEGPVNDDWYRRLFEHIDENDWAVDFSTSNGRVNDLGFQKMASFTEETKAIMILRHPLDRLASHIRLDADRTGAAEKKDPKEWGKRKLTRFVDDRHLLERSLYAPIVAGTLKHFAPQNRLILNYEDIAVDPAATVTRVMEFLGVTPDPKVIDALEPRDPMAKGKRKAHPKLSSYAAPCLEHLREVSALGIDMVDPWIEDLEKIAAN